MAIQTRSQRRNEGDSEENSRVAPAQERDAEQVEENVDNQGTGNRGARAGGTELGMLSQVLMVLTQLVERFPAATPVPNVVTGNRTPVVNDAAVAADIEDPVVNTRVPSYLKVMDHMQKLGTRYFKGSAKPMEADEWRSKIDRNFCSIRCPEQYKTDIAVHFLEGDAHTWWKGVLNRKKGVTCTWETFCEEFNSKYFPQEAVDRLEGEFLDLRQGSRTVREYEIEFNSLKKYGGKDLEDEKTQVRRFMRGMRLGLRNRCLASNYGSIAELVEKAALIEAGLAEEAQLEKERLANRPSRTNNLGGSSRNWPQNNMSGKSRACTKCGKMHQGACKSCFRCGSVKHQLRECPKEDTRGNAPVRNLEAIVCYHCNEQGHYKSNCPLLGRTSLKRANEELPPPPKRQAVMPRVYAMAREANDPSSSRPITGEFENLSFVNFQ